MTSRRQPWSVLVAEQRNNQLLRPTDVMFDGDPTLRNIQGIVISINWSTAVAEHLWTQKKWYTLNQTSRQRGSFTRLITVDFSDNATLFVYCIKRLKVMGIKKWPV